MDFQLWPSKSWQVKFTAVDDLGETDTLSFTLAGPNQIRVSGVGCNHFGTSPHSGAKWQEVCQPLAGNPNAVQGDTILITSEAVGISGKTKLTCTLVIPFGSTGGGACWTAEDG